jgi:hypothetical protein
MHVERAAIDNRDAKDSGRRFRHLGLIKIEFDNTAISSFNSPREHLGDEVIYQSRCLCNSGEQEQYSTCGDMTQGRPRCS